MNTIENKTNTKHTTGECQFQAPGVCHRKQYTLTFLFDQSRREAISTCVHCDVAGFVPLGPQPAINFLSRR